MTAALLDRGLALVADHCDGTLDADARARAKLLAQCPTPADLAARFDPTYVRTPAGDLISREIVQALTAYDGRLTVSQPPQSGKSLTLRWACVWLLLRDPDTRIVFASYAASLARTSGRIIRALIDTYCGPYGLRLDRSHADASDWQLDGHLGGVYSAGTFGALTGRACSAMIIDDPHPSMEAADSPTQRGAVLEWWSSVARTRLAPGAPVIGVATRWHHLDLLSKFIADDWPRVNIPALADGKVLDSLGRPVGEYLQTPRNTTPDDWRNTRKESGERTWSALHQGDPTPAEGGAFKSGWFDTWRVTSLPTTGCLRPVVVVDPADNEGDGDEAGILLAVPHPESGRVFIVDDLSAPMTVARWARVALLTCVRRDAPTLAFEQSLSLLPKRIRECWRGLHQQAVALHRVHYDPVAALARLVRVDDSAETRAAIEQGLLELSCEDVATIVRIGESGPTLRKIPAKGSKESRMLWAAPMFETGRAVIVGHLPALEYQAAVWQQGMRSPDRVDAMVHACALADSSTGSIGRSTERVPTSSTSARARTQIRSTGRGRR